MSTGFGSSRHGDEAGLSGDVLSIAVHGGTHEPITVSLSGELDFSNAQLLLDAVQSVELDGQRAVVLDLAGLSFCDAAGLSAVVRANRLLGRRGGRLTIHGATGLPHRVLALSGIDSALEEE